MAVSGVFVASRGGELSMMTLASLGLGLGTPENPLSGVLPHEGTNLDAGQTHLNVE